MFWKRFFIVVGVLIILAFIAQLIVAPYVKDLITKKVKEALGSEVSIGNCAISILKGRIVLENVSIPNPQNKDELLIKAKELNIDFYLIPLLFHKQILQVLSLTQPELILRRDETGTLKLPQFQKAQENKKVVRKTKPNIFVKRLLVKNGSLKLIDHFVTRPPTVITFSDLNCDIINSLSLVDKKILTHINVQGRIEEEGKFTVNGKGDFISKPISFDGDIKIEDVSLPKLTPYYGENLSIIVKRGSLNIDSKALCDKGNLNVKSDVRIDNIDLEPIGDPSQTILFEQKTIDVLNFLKDENETVKFTFVVNGDLNNPEFKWGPEVQRALRKAMIRSIVEGMARFLLKSPQKVGEMGEKIGNIIGGEAGEKVKKTGEKLQEQLEKILGK